MRKESEKILAELGFKPIAAGVGAKKATQPPTHVVENFKNGTETQARLGP